MVNNELQPYDEPQEPDVLRVTRHMVTRIEEIRDQVDRFAFAVNVRALQAQIEADTILEIELCLSPRRKR